MPQRAETIANYGGGVESIVIGLESIVIKPRVFTYLFVAASLAPNWVEGAQSANIYGNYYEKVNMLRRWQTWFLSRP